MRQPLRKACVLPLALALAATFLAGCAAPWPFPQPTPDLKLPDSQQILRPQEIGPASGDLETLDPALVEFYTDYDNAQLLFPGLVTLDEHSQPVDWAATSHEVSADGLTYTFHLRTGMVWSDGTPIDAQTFAYSINRSEDPCTDSSTANYLDPIKGATALYHETCPTGATHVADTLIGTSVIASDPQTLTILLNQPTGYFLTALTSSTAWAVPQQLIEKYADKWTDHLRDNGGFGGNLYRLTKWDHVGHIEFERNERFWGKKPLLRRIEYTLYKPNDTVATDAAWDAFLQGNSDVGYPSTVVLDGARRLKGVTFQQTPLVSINFLTPNWHIAPFDDVRVRQAFSLALDRQKLARDTRQGAVIPSIHLVPAGMPGYNPALADAAGRTGADALTPDLTKAHVLANAYVAEKCGGAMETCPGITLVYASQGLVENAIIGQWKAAFPNWRIFANGCGRGCQQLQYARQSYQLLHGGWLADYPDPQDFLSLLWSTHATYNRSYVSIPAVDALCAQADALGNQAGRIQLYQQAEQLLVTQGAAIPLYQNMTTSVVRSRVVGWRLAPLGMTPLSVWQATYIRR